MKDRKQRLSRYTSRGVYNVRAIQVSCLLEQMSAKI
jgi:hypothetical protein